jgi:Flp pilus assembly protein TadG
MRLKLRTRLAADRGSALIETAFTVPLILLVCVSIFEFGRAYQYWQVLTNAAREGARIAVLPGATDGDVTARVQQYLSAGQLASPTAATVDIDDAQISVGGSNRPASMVTVSYPFQFMVLQPVAQLVVRGSTAGAPITMATRATMRDE